MLNLEIDYNVPTNGIINFLKPAGMTSHDAVAFFRRLTGIKRIGHTGTLDPMAVGVLPICLGSSARIMDYLDLDFKKYRCEIALGYETDTQDIWGKVISPQKFNCEDLKKFNITKEKIMAALNEFKGEILQYPPKYSALKVNGKKLYEYARQDLDVDIKPRKVTIKAIEFLRFDEEKFTIMLDILCSKGTYIRTICRDLGEALGTNGTMSFLLRTASGRFSIEETVTVESLAKLKDEEKGLDWDSLKTHILPTDYPLVHFGKAKLNVDRGGWFINGGHISMKEVEIEKASGHNDFYNLYDKNNKFLGVCAYNYEYKKLVAEKVFTTIQEYSITGR